MSIISPLIIIFIICALIWTFWSMLSSVAPQLKLSRGMAAVVIAVLVTLFSVMFTILYLLLASGPVNAGSLLGMLLGITLILSGIRTFTRQQ